MTPRPRATAARQMLGALDMHEAGEPRGREPHRRGGISSTAIPQTREVPIEQLFTRPRGQFGKNTTRGCVVPVLTKPVGSRRSTSAQRSSDRYHTPERQKQRHYT